jgi:tRNA-2-methylthio-N6-dimethylallyladenosine synthase
MLNCSFAMPNVYIKTYGCQMNERDSEAVAAQLVARGYSLARSEAEADVILLNTCSVRDFAEQKALHKMTALVADRRRWKQELVLGFLGCMAQSRGQQLLDQLPDVDLVLGTQKLHRAADYLDHLLARKTQKVVDTDPEARSESAVSAHLTRGDGKPAVTAFVSIMQGCNQYCTFCIVPYTRGRERSRPIAELVEECRLLAARGVKEVTLLGQIVTSYGRAFPRTASGISPFVQLLEDISQVPGLERIRFTSPHPKGYGDDLIEAYSRIPQMAQSAHIPVQSGSDRVLKFMHRGYTRQRFLDIVARLRRVNPEIGISTDFISGFPGETDADFKETLSLVEEVQFDQAFVFKYSERRDTPAAVMPNPVPWELREERNRQLLALVNQVAARRYENLVGRRLRVLVEGPSKRNPARMMGRTSCNRIVVFEGSERHRGQLLDVNILRAGCFTLYGDPAIIGLKNDDCPVSTLPPS